MESNSSTDTSYWLQWLMRLLLFIVCGSLVMTLVNGLYVISTGFNIHLMSFQDLTPQERITHAWHYRVVLFIQHLCLFILPGSMFAYWYHKKTNRSIIPFHSDINTTITWASVGILILSYPLVQFVAELNTKIPLPSYMRHLEDQSLQVIQLMMENKTVPTLMANLFLMALVPAIGEELIFRGGIQHLGLKIFKNPQLVVWITAFLFSAMHMQFEGFFPRMLLGLILGYIMLWSGNILYPMIAHFFHNGLQILIQYFIIKDVTQLSSMEDYNAPIWSVFISVFILIFFTQWYKKSTGYTLKQHT